jgi:hypothetical protein
VSHPAYTPSIRTNYPCQDQGYRSCRALKSVHPLSKTMWRISDQGSLEDPQATIQPDMYQMSLCVLPASFQDTDMLTLLCEPTRTQTPPSKLMWMAKAKMRTDSNIAGRARIDNQRFEIGYRAPLVPPKSLSDLPPIPTDKLTRKIPPLKRVLSRVFLENGADAVCGYPYLY